jgi:hypothetical protein
MQRLTTVGNHDITLDAAFYEQHGSSWRWPRSQDPEQCRQLFKDSPSITYLENEVAVIRLTSSDGPQTSFQVFGSPCTPKVRDWAFQYEPEEAMRLWSAIPVDTDIVVTHTPPKGYCDGSTKDDRTGCDALRQALYRVRPMLSVFGHIHEARGVQRVQWNDRPDNGSLQRCVEVWKDPGVGNNKQSLVDLTAKGGHPLGNCSALVLPSNTFSPIYDAQDQDIGGQAGESEVPQPDTRNSTSHPEDISGSKVKGRTKLGGAIGYRQASLLSDVGLTAVPDVEDLGWRTARRETVMINAAFKVDPGSNRGLKQFNKPVVVDIDLPVWRRSG